MTRLTATFSKKLTLLSLVEEDTELTMHFHTAS